MQVYDKVYYVLLFKTLLSVGKERVLKGALFFVSFFLIFATAVFFIPTPMFPGDFILKMTNAQLTASQEALMSALINGICYGLIAWAFFAVAMRKIGSESGSSSESQVKSQNQAKSESKRSRKPRR